MTRWLVVTLLFVLCGCSVRLTGDASMFKKYDRPAESWSMETKETPAAPATGGTK